MATYCQWQGEEAVRGGGHGETQPSKAHKDGAS